MRATHFTRRILQGGLALMLLQTVSATALAWELPRPKDDSDGLRKQWVCEYMRGPDSVPYMFCEDLASLLYDDYGAENERPEGSAKYFPLWGQPKSDGKALELAQLLLCNQKAQCSVQLANGAGGTRIALR